MTSDFTSQLFQLLTTTVSAKDGNEARNTTSTLNKQFYSDPNCVPALVQIASEAADKSIRQLAAVEARKRVDRHWERLSNDVKSAVRAKLIERVAAESEQNVSHSLAHVIAAIAEREWSSGAWPGLMPMIVDASQSSIASHREVAMYVLLTLFQAVPIDAATQMPHLLKVLAQGLLDSESALVRTTSLEAIGAAADLLEASDKEPVKIVQELVPTMMKVLADVIASGDESAVSRGFNVFDSMLSVEAPLLNPHFTVFVEFLVSTFRNPQLSDEVRVMAGNLIVLLPLHRRARLSKHKLIEPILTHVIPVAVETDGEDDEDEDSPGRSALRIVNAFATNLPAQHVFPLVSAKIVEFASSFEPLARRAAMICIALIVDGCTDAMRSHAEDLVQLVLRLMQDENKRVRRAACLALSALAESLEMEVCAMHSHILPILFNLMQDVSSLDVLRNATNALDTILEGLGDDIHLYIHGLMETLMRLLGVPDTKIRQVVVAAIGSTAHAAGEQFTQYLPHVYSPIVEIMGQVSDDSEQLLLRGIATDTMAAIAGAVSVDAFRPHLQQTAQLAAEAMQIDMSKLKECAFCFFSVLSRVFKEEFTPFLPSLVPILFQSIRAEETFIGDEDHDLSISTGDASNDNADDSGLGEGDEDSFEAHNAIAEEKATAMEVLGDLFEHTRGDFLPYLDESVALLSDNTTHYSEDIRKAIALSFFKILTTMHSMSQPQPWVAGLPVQVMVHENVVRMNQVVMDKTLKMLEEEDDRTVAAEICDCIATTLRVMGPVLVSQPPHLEVLINLLIAIFEGKHLAQQDAEGEELDADEIAELDGVLLSGAGDVVGALATTLGGSAFTPIAQKVLPHVSKYFKPNSQTPERSMAVGTLAEAAYGMQKEVTSWHQPFHQVFMLALKDPACEVRSNGAYGMGVLCENTDASYHAASILTMLVPMTVRSTVEAKALPQSCDNASGAIARILYRGDAWRAQSEALMAFVESLPMRVDYEENKPAMRLISHLMRLAISSDEDAQRMIIGQEQVLQKIMGAIAHPFLPSKYDHIEDECRANLISLLRELAASSICGPIQKAISSLPQEYQSAIHQAMT